MSNKSSDSLKSSLHMIAGHFPLPSTKDKHRSATKRSKSSRRSASSSQLTKRETRCWGAWILVLFFFFCFCFLEISFDWECFQFQLRPPVERGSERASVCAARQITETEAVTSIWQSNVTVFGRNRWRLPGNRQVVKSICFSGGTVTGISVETRQALQCGDTDGALAFKKRKKRKVNRA